MIGAQIIGDTGDTTVGSAYICCLSTPHHDDDSPIIYYFAVVIYARELIELKQIDPNSMTTF